MSYSVTLSDDGQYIVCRVDGPVTTAVARGFTLEMHRLSREAGVKRFLTDVREARNVLGPLDNYEYAYKDMRAMNAQRDIRSAVLVAPDDDSHNFVETVVRNAGYNLRLYRDEGEALAWLSE